MTFQVSDNNGKKFLDLNDNDNLPTKSTYFKYSMWLNFIGHSNTLYMRAIKAITNHTSIGEYWLRFFPKEPFICSCREYPIKSKNHILYNCRKFNKYWNPNRKLLKHFFSFLEFNPGAFFFYERNYLTMVSLSFYI